MSRPRKIAHWKKWGWSYTCSDCGFCGTMVPTNFCENCGDEMADPMEAWCPPLPKMEPLTVYICKRCGKKILGPKNYCPDCGEEVKK